MDCFLIDGGTTNTRVWLRRGAKIIGPERLAVGVRDTAITGNNSRLKATLAEAFRHLAGTTPPQLAVAAGMITSPLGLTEVPHAQAPAGARELAAAAAEEHFPEFAGIRFLLIPGVRSGPRQYSVASVENVDIIRGEETEIIGAIALGRVTPPLLFIHIGSHTKAITVAGDGRITGGASTLGGEVFDAVGSHTILASAIRGAGDKVSRKMLIKGAESTEFLGLTRALFLVRLLEQGRRWSPEELRSYLLGAVIRSDLQGILPDEIQPVVLSGPDAALPAWAILLDHYAQPSVKLNSRGRETAFLAGIQQILSLREDSL